jgi:hypothetical protein
MTDSLTAEAASPCPALDLTDPETLARVQQEYAEAIPRIEAHAKVHFRGIRDPGRRGDAIQDTIGIGWKHWLSAIKNGKDPKDFVSSIAEMAVRHVRVGRLVWRQEPAKDVMSPRAQHSKGFAVEQLNVSTARPHEQFYSDPHGQEQMDTLEERLADNTRTPPPEQAAFREQYGMLLEQMGPRNGPIVDDMAAGENTFALADKYKLSPGRVSQLRREAEKTWRKIDAGDDELGR